MNYRLYASPAGERSLKKLSPPIQKQLREEIQSLKTDPKRGELLRDKFRFFRSLHVSYHGTQYRVIYEVDETNEEIHLLYVGSRENLYRDLAHLKLKSVLRRAG
ncbi:MAG: type II toxin-antitoxin system mRNA interferase toxin, RelE/StbE family [Chloroflexi bacterium]|nr:type II toxin-antitoxin system mRNA interferase toxin, RelE/StbE family [Chloroflexota bacterium]